MKRGVVAGVVLLLGWSLLLLSQNAQELYQRALVQEQAAGKLPQAIELYLKAAKEAGNDRTLAAKALIRAAASHEKLGQPEAVNLYTEVTRMYPEQREQVQIAQVRLVTLRQTAPVTSEIIEYPLGISAVTDLSAVVSPFFEEYCMRCHNPTARVYGFRLDSLNTKNVGENTAAWENVLRRLYARRDPPVGLPRPEEKTYQSIIAKLEAALDKAYRVNTPLNATDRASDSEIAKRMATFIWADAPDAALLEDAKQGRLHEPAVLNRQVLRMLRDPKSTRLVTGFFEPKFKLDKLDNSRPDPLRFPEFNQSLLQAMKTETRLFLENQLRENHGALELWTADYSFLNERLASHYGISNITGSEFRRVKLPGNYRAGLLGQGSFLTITSAAGRTSPVLRGIWILENFLGTTAPPPPPNVPPLASTPEDLARPMSERMADHAVNPNCMSCHVIIDPLGFALENFDGVGKWRNTDADSRIAVSGTFTNGLKYNGPVEFRTGLLKYRDAYYSNITQHLLGYALGRKASDWKVYDFEMPAVRATLRAAARDDFRWAAIISGIVKSDPFQQKNIAP